ncbi:MAG: hypothetical protein K6B73_07370 [Treponema sp.]|nr:hypothetical protein [Treponema sp.]
MTDGESKIIDHLIQIESLAAGVVQKADQEAGEIITAAKTKAESQYIERYNKKTENLSRQFAGDCNKIQADADEQIKKYKDSINSTVVNKKTFDTQVKSILKEFAKV